MPNTMIFMVTPGTPFLFKINDLRRFNTMRLWISAAWYSENGYGIR
jgi:hypothetical protein